MAVSPTITAIYNQSQVDDGRADDKLINREPRNVKFGALSRTRTSQFSRQPSVINTTAHGIVWKQATTRGRISILVPSAVL